MLENSNKRKKGKKEREWDWTPADRQSAEPKTNQAEEGRLWPLVPHGANRMNDVIIVDN